jgi:glycosyltransferase involved in cell wall biosynthesis
MTIVDLSNQRRSVRRRLNREWQAMKAMSLPRLRRNWIELLSVAEDRDRLRRARAGAEVCASSEPEPLISVRIATHRRPQLLVERAIAGILAQTYQHFEIVIVSDGPDDATRDAVAAVADPRIRYFELGRQTEYPSTPRDRWLVAGYHPMNVAISLCRGDWIAPCDDDDQPLPRHLETLLRHAQRHRLEFVYGKTEIVISETEKVLVGDSRLREGHITHGAVLYASPLSFFRYSGRSYLLGEPFDWNLWKRMKRAGVRMGFVDEVVYRYFPAGHTRQLYARQIDARR